MSLSAIGWAWRQNLSPNAKLALIYLADSTGTGSDVRGKTCELSAWMGVAVIELFEALDEMADASLLHGSWDECTWEITLSWERKTSPYRQNHNERVRGQLREKVKQDVLDNALRRCVVCSSNENMHVDHIVPISRGGTNDFENLQALCGTCNMAKGTKTMDEWLGNGVDV